MLNAKFKEIINQTSSGWNHFDPNLILTYNTPSSVPTDKISAITQFAVCKVEPWLCLAFHKSLKWHPAFAIIT